MQIGQRNTAPNNLILKLFSVVLGYILWSIMSQSHITTSQFAIPIFFYNIPQHTKIVAPETVSIQLRGTKKILRTLSTEPLAAHIDVQPLKGGDNLISLSKSTLFLPNQVELLQAIPSPLVVSLEPS